MKKTTIALAVLAAASMVPVATPVFAQDFALEEVVVTARKRT